MKERELRKINKKIRHLKSKESWEMKKIGELEKDSSLLEKDIACDKKKKNEISVRETKEKTMTDDDWMDRFREETPVNIDDHIIPNTRETRLLRKKVIQNIQTHMIDEEVVRHLQLKRIMDSIDRIQKEQEKKKKNKTNQITS